MQVFTAAGFAFSHGSNDIANAIGPFAAVLDVLHTNGISAQAPVPPIAMLSFGIASRAGCRSHRGACRIVTTGAASE